MINGIMESSSSNFKELKSGKLITKVAQNVTASLSDEERVNYGVIDIESNSKYRAIYEWKLKVWKWIASCYYSLSC